MSASPISRFLILGTAGHIDHGKSSLVRALTGVDPDRLPEEKARGMTIELGFASLDLPAARLGVVDVPGHERFIRTMVSGATGMDLAMLVVAADDGVMPQTREHVEILDLLGIAHGVVALNKADLADDERLAAAAKQVAELTNETPLADWRIVPVSAATGRGLDELRAALSAVIERLPPRRTSSVFRLAIDRVFAVQGRGTVVTGSVLSGAAAAGLNLELHPGPLPCRVRELQSHGHSAADVRAGQRAALNLTGVDRERIERGMELATPRVLTPARYLDARLRVLARNRSPVESFDRLRVAMATWEHMATAVVLDGDAVAPGDRGLVQLRFAVPVVAAHGQRFIIRAENAHTTLGGGVVLRPVSRRLTRRDVDQSAQLAALEQGDDAARLAEALRAGGFQPRPDATLACWAGLEPGAVAPLRTRLRAETVLTAASTTIEVHRDVLAALRLRAVQHLTRHHVRAPGEPGIPVERFVGWIDRRAGGGAGAGGAEGGARSGLAGGVGRSLLAALQSDGEVVIRGPFVAHRSHRPALSPEDEKMLSAVLAELTAAGLDPPEWVKLAGVAGQSKQRQSKLLELARGDARLVQIGPAHFAAAEAVERFRAAVRELGAAGRRFKLAEVRDKLGLNRRAVQAMLEYFDRVQFTRRVGDERVVVER